MTEIGGNLFSGSESGVAPGERIEQLLLAPSLRLERIVSVAHATPAGQWYDQPWPEWVVVLQGSAGLLLEGADHVMVLRAGDYVLLPAHLRHRVEWTDAEMATVWLALHYSPAEGEV